MSALHLLACHPVENAVLSCQVSPISNAPILIHWVFLIFYPHDLWLDLTSLTSLRISGFMASLEVFTFACLGHIINSRLLHILIDACAVKDCYLPMSDGNAYDGSTAHVAYLLFLHDACVALFACISLTFASPTGHSCFTLCNFLLPL